MNVANLVYLYINPLWLRNLTLYSIQFLAKREKSYKNGDNDRKNVKPYYLFDENTH